ncbi:hypothetical protein ACHAWF_014213 [Thalassiosira exigua]
MSTSMAMTRLSAASVVYRRAHSHSPFLWFLRRLSSSLPTGAPAPNSDEPPAPGNRKQDDGTSPSSALLQSVELDVSTRSVGQVIFLNSLDSGRVVFVSLALGDPTLAALAALGTATANTTSKIIGLDEKTRKDGLWGYNGALIGCAMSVFGPTYLPLMVVSTLFGAAATPVLSASLRGAISIPQWTWSFNIVTLTSLIRTRPLMQSEDAEDVVSVPVAAGDIVMSPLKGMSQIFVADSAVTGAGLLAATYLYSPKLAAHAFGGSVTGSLVGLLLGADLPDICIGLWGYNSALTSMAVGTFYVHSNRTVVLSASGAAASAFLFGTMQTLFGEFGVPCLTLPFCSIATGCYLLGGHIPGLKLAAEPHSPEKNA